MNEERWKGKESICGKKKEALLSAKEVKKFVTEWRNNLIKTDKSSAIFAAHSQSPTIHFCSGVLRPLFKLKKKTKKQKTLNSKLPFSRIELKVYHRLLLNSYRKSCFFKESPEILQDASMFLLGVSILSFSVLT